MQEKDPGQRRPQPPKEDKSEFFWQTFGHLSLMLPALAIALWGWSGLGRIDTQYSVHQFLPKEHPSYGLDEKVQKQFQLNPRSAVGVVVQLPEGQTGTWLKQKNVERLRKAHESITGITGIKKVISIGSVEGAIHNGSTTTIANLIDSTPEKQRPRRILSDPFLTPTLISRDGRLATIWIDTFPMSVADERYVQTEIKGKLAQWFEPKHFKVGGIPAIQSDLTALLSHELALFLTLSALVCALGILMIFRSFSALVVACSLNLLCNLAVIGWMASQGIAFTVISTVIPIMIFVTVMTICCHVMLRIHEEMVKNPHLSKAAAIWKANKELFMPNLISPLTTLIGFVTLLWSDVPVMRSYGQTVMGAVMLSWFLTQIFLVPVLNLLPLARPREWTQKDAYWILPVFRWAKPIAVSVVVATVVLVIAGTRLHWTATIFDDLPRNHPARLATETIDRHMGGVLPLQIVISGEEESTWNDPERLKRLDQFLVDIRQLPGVGTATGVPDLVRAVNPVSHNSRLPTSRQAAAEIYFLYSLSEQSPLPNLLTADGRATRLEVRLKDIPANEMKALIKDISEMARVRFPEDKVEVAGLAASVHDINEVLSKDLIHDFWLSLLITTAALIMVFRSWRWALAASLPNIVPPVALLGIMGLAATPIKPVVAMIFSVVLGLAFGNTVYIINRLREMRKGYRLPVKRAYLLEGNPCLISTWITASGFFVFIFSDFSLNRTFGAYILISTVVGLVGDLLLLPSVLHWLPQLIVGRKPVEKVRKSIRLQPAPVAAPVPVAAPAAAGMEELAVEGAVPLATVTSIEEARKKKAA